MRSFHGLKPGLTCLAAIALSYASAFALAVDNPLPDAGQEARARALFHDIRCVTCQSESIADSPSEVAGAMRDGIRGMVAAGMGNKEIKARLASRYGDHILMQPPLSHATIILWFGPVIIFVLALLVAFSYFRTPKEHDTAV